MSETNSTNPGSAPATATAGTSLAILEDYFSKIQGLLEESFRDLGIRTTWQDDVSGPSGVHYEPLNTDSTTSEAIGLISRINERVPGGFLVSNGGEGDILYEMGRFAKFHPAAGIRQAATRISALVASLECLSITVKQDDNKIYFETSDSATGEEVEESQRLICRIGRADPPPTSGPSPSEAPTAE